MTLQINLDAKQSYENYVLNTDSRYKNTVLEILLEIRKVSSNTTWICLESFRSILFDYDKGIYPINNTGKYVKTVLEQMGYRVDIVRSSNSIDLVIEWWEPQLRGK